MFHVKQAEGATGFRRVHRPLSGFAPVGSGVFLENDSSFDVNCGVADAKI